MEKQKVIEHFEIYLKTIDKLKDSEDHHDGEEFFMDYGVDPDSPFALAVKSCIEHLSEIGSRRKYKLSTINSFNAK